MSTFIENDPAMWSEFECSQVERSILQRVDEQELRRDIECFVRKVYKSNG